MKELYSYFDWWSDNPPMSIAFLAFMMAMTAFAYFMARGANVEWDTWQCTNCGRKEKTSGTPTTVKRSCPYCGGTMRVKEYSQEP